MKRAALALLCGAAWGTACSSGAPFGTSPPGDADASTDASSEGSSTDDAQSEGSPSPADGASPSLCADAAAHDLCEDFDKEPLAAGSWLPGLQSTPDAGLAAIDQGESTSPPSSLLATLSTQGFVNQRSFLIHRDIVGTATKKVVLSFDLFVDTLERDDAGTGPNADSMIASIGDGTYTNEIRVANASGLLAIGVVEVSPGAYYFQTYTFGAHILPVRQWHRFVITADHAQNTVGLSIDGMTGTPAQAPTFHVPSSAAVNLAVELGSQTDQPAETIKVFFDDVTVDLDR